MVFTKAKFDTLSEKKLVKKLIKFLNKADP